MMTSRFLTLAAVTLALVTTAGFAPAQPSAEPAPKIPLTAITDGKHVIFSWREAHGGYALVLQNPAGKGDWKAAVGGSFRTNGYDITATFPLPAKTARYRLKPVYLVHPPTPPPLPPMPSLHGAMPTPPAPH
jgi:hypothetical protein